MPVMSELAGSSPALAYAGFKETKCFFSAHHPQEVLLDQFSIYVHKGGVKSRTPPEWSVSIFTFIEAEIANAIRSLKIQKWVISLFCHIKIGLKLEIVPSRHNTLNQCWSYRVDLR